MAKKEVEALPWERQPDESPKAYEAFTVYRDLGKERTLPKVAEQCGKSVSLMSRWSQAHSWVERVNAWDDEADRKAAQKQLNDIANARVRQRKQAVKMQLKALQLLESIQEGDAKLSEIVSLMKLGMEQERICLGDVGDVIEERSGEAVPSVQIYIPDNNRGKDKDTFDDLEVEK